LRAGRIALHSAAGALFLAGMACSGALDVPNPQAFGDDALNNPIILKTVADGAEGSVHQAYDDMIQITELNSDDMESTSTWIDWEDISEGRLRHDWPTPGSFSFPQDLLLRARFAAQSAKERVDNVLGTAAGTSPLRAQVMLMDAIADLLFGMSACEGPLTADAARSPDTEFFKQAVTKFTAALTAAQAISGDAAAKAKWTDVAYAGRARANLLAGNYAAAKTDAQAVSAGFVYNALYQELAQSATGNQFHQNRNRSGGLRRMYHARVHEIDPAPTGTGEAYLRDWFDNTKDDKRMAVTRKTGQLGVNNRFAYYGITKYNDRNAPIRMFSKIEMTLIEAEAAFRVNDYATMTTLLNSLRTRAGVALPAIPVPASAAEAQAALLNERQAELFVEGHRQQDLHRFNMVNSLLGPGHATKLPLSRNEILNNTNMTDGGGACPSVS
jgi:hypothetical protein